MWHAVGPGTGLRAGGILGKPVAPVVVLMACMTFGPDPVRFVDPNQLVKFHPKIGVANRVILLPPVAPFPSDHPLRNSLPNVLGVGRDFYFARLLEREEALDHRHQLHSIVGCVRIVAEELLLHRAEAQDAGPPSRTGIAQARSIGNQRNLLHRPKKHGGGRYLTTDVDFGIAARCCRILPARTPEPCLHNPAGA